MATKSKRAAPKRIKTGLAGAPKTDDFFKLKRYFHQELDKKIISKIVKDFIKKRFNSSDQKNIFANPEYMFTMYSHVGASCYWADLGKEFPENWDAEEKLFNTYFKELIESGKSKREEKASSNAPSKTTEIKVNPIQLLKNKVNSTILTELDDIEEAWMNDEKPGFDIYSRMMALGLKGASVPHVLEYIEPRLQELLDSKNKSCPQAVEAFSHLTRREVSRRIRFWEGLLNDLTKLKTSAKAARKPRAKKAVDATKQVAKLKYKKSDPTLKVTSIDPTSIVGSQRLLVLNCKYKTITEYFSNSTKGFAVKGTTLQNFDTETSRTKTMRKPEEFLVNVSKTVKRFDKLFSELTTKERVPNGRFNEETVILRAD
jgi:hypothetical protein